MFLQNNVFAKQCLTTYKTVFTTNKNNVLHVLNNVFCHFSIVLRHIATADCQKAMNLCSVKTEKTFDALMKMIDCMEDECTNPKKSTFLFSFNLFLVVDKQAGRHCPALRVQYNGSRNDLLMWTQTLDDHCGNLAKATSVYYETAAAFTRAIVSKQLPSSIKDKRNDESLIQLKSKTELATAVFVIASVVYCEMCARGDSPYAAARETNACLLDVFRQVAGVGKLFHGMNPGGRQPPKKKRKTQQPHTIDCGVEQCADCIT